MFDRKRVNNECTRAWYIFIVAVRDPWHFSCLLKKKSFCRKEQLEPSTHGSHHPVIGYCNDFKRYESVGDVVIKMFVSEMV